MWICGRSRLLRTSAHDATFHQFESHARRPFDSRRPHTDKINRDAARSQQCPSALARRSRRHRSWQARFYLSHTWRTTTTAKRFYRRHTWRTTTTTATCASPSPPFASAHPIRGPARWAHRLRLPTTRCRRPPPEDPPSFIMGDSSVGSLTATQLGDLNASIRITSGESFIQRRRSTVIHVVDKVTPHYTPLFIFKCALCVGCIFLVALGGAMGVLLTMEEESAGESPPPLPPMPSLSPPPPLVVQIHPPPPPSPHRRRRPILRRRHLLPTFRHHLRRRPRCRPLPFIATYAALLAARRR